MVILSGTLSASAITGAKHLPHALPSLSVDGIILAVVGLVVVYTLIAGYAALVRESISIYVGLVLAGNFGRPLYEQITGGAGSKFSVSQTDVQMLLLIIPIVVLQFGRRHHHSAHRHNLVVTLISALLTALLLVSSALGQLSDLALTTTLEQSNLASWIYQFRLLWLALVPLAIVATGLLGSGVLKRHHKEH